MFDNPKSETVKGFAKLKQKQARSETGLFLLEGPQGLRELDPGWADLVLVTDAAADKLEVELDRIARLGVRIERATDAVVDKISDTSSPQGVIAICRQRLAPPATLTHVNLVAVLENPSDPGNLGAVIRAADAAGADAVAVVQPSVDLFNPKVVRATAGSIFHIPLISFESIEDAVAQAKTWGTQVLGASADGVDIRSEALNLKDKTTWFFGNEAHGLSRQAREAVDAVVSLPIFGAAESLNLATAATLCLYQSALASRLRD